MHSLALALACVLAVLGGPVAASEEPGVRWRHLKSGVSMTLNTAADNVTPFYCDDFASWSLEWIAGDAAPSEGEAQDLGTCDATLSVYAGWPLADSNTTVRLERCLHCVHCVGRVGCFGAVQAPLRHPR